MSGNNWAVSLGARFKDQLRDAAEADGTIPKIFRPIDEEVSELLTPLQRAALTYNPLRTEDLFEALTARLALCLQLRERAQQLDNEAFREISDIQFKLDAAEQNKSLLEWSRVYNRRLIQNQTELRISQAKAAIDGTSPTEWMPAHLKVEAAPLKPLEPAPHDPTTPAHGVDWSAFVKAQNALVNLVVADANTRLQRFSRSSGAGAFVNRFNQLVRAFKIDLEEAYMLARSLHAGLPESANINPIPDLTKSDYLDELLIWLKKSADSYNRYLEKRQSITIIIPFIIPGQGLLPGNKARLMPDSEFESRLKIGEFNFEFTAELMQALKIPAKPKLRGIDLWFTGSDAGVAPSTGASEIVFGANGRLPDQKSEFAPFHAGLDFWFPPVRHLSLMDGGSDITVPRQLVNADITGSWSIKIRWRAARNEEAVAQIKNMFLRLRLQVDR